VPRQAPAYPSLIGCVLLEIESLFSASFLHLAHDVFNEISVNHMMLHIESANFSFVHQNRSISELDCVA